MAFDTISGIRGVGLLQVHFIIAVPTQELIHGAFSKVLHTQTDTRV